MYTTTKIKSKRKESNILVWKILFVVGILSFLIYGLSFFFAKPSVETVITPAPPVNAAASPTPPHQFVNHPRSEETPKHRHS